MELLKFFIVSRTENNIGIKVCNLRQGVHYNFVVKKKDTYKDHKENGISTWWYKNGHPYEDDYWVDEKLHGLCRRWYAHGQIHHEHNYVNGKFHGLCCWWDDDGLLFCESLCS